MKGLGAEVSSPCELHLCVLLHLIPRASPSPGEAAWGYPFPCGAARLLPLLLILLISPAPPHPTQSLALLFPPYALPHLRISLLYLWAHSRLGGVLDTFTSLRVIPARSWLSVSSLFLTSHS